MLNQITFFAIAVGAIAIILGSAHWALYKSIVRFFAIENPTLILSLKIILVLLSVSFVLASLLSSRYYNWPVRTFYVLAAGWQGFLYLFLITSLIAWILYYFNVRLTPVYLGGLFALAILIGIYGLVHANNPQVTRLNIKLNNLPPEWQGKTAVWVSDIHLGQVRGAAFSQQVVDKINKLNPELVFVGGDLFDGVAGDYNQMAAPFSQLKATQGAYFITGNHEEFDGKTEFIAAAQNAHLQVLDNQMIDLNGLQIIGVDYRDTSSRANFRRIMDGLNIDKSHPIILLKHSPYYVEEAEKYGVDIQLSGHSHQGQIFPIQYISRLVFYGYEFGLHKLGNLLIYTSSGTGTWGPPMRLGTNAEIVQITFQ
jgi:uncharacterized protein